MSDVSELVVSWLKPSATGILGLVGGMPAEEVRAALGKVSERKLPSPALKVFESFGELDRATLTEVECVLRDEKLIEVRAHVKLRSAAAKRSTVEAVSGALGGLAEPTGKRAWTAGEATFGLRASSDDVLEEGMPIDVETSVKWATPA